MTLNADCQTESMLRHCLSPGQGYFCMYTKKRRHSYLFIPEPSMLCADAGELISIGGGAGGRFERTEQGIRYAATIYNNESYAPNSPASF